MSVNNEKGTAFIEAALVMPLLIFLLVGTIDLANMIHKRATIEYVNHQVMRKLIMNAPSKDHPLKTPSSGSTINLGFGETLTQTNSFIYVAAFEMLHFHGFKVNDFRHYQPDSNQNPNDHIEFEIVDDPTKPYLFYKQSISVANDLLILPKGFFGDGIKTTRVYYLER